MTLSKRFYFGKISAQFSDEIIITNDDVYGSDPKEIAKQNIELGIMKLINQENRSMPNYFGQARRR